MDKEKRDWMEEVGFREFKKPMKYILGTNQVFSEEYIKKTPLKELKERYKKHIDYIDSSKGVKSPRLFFKKILRRFTTHKNINWSSYSDKVGDSLSNTYTPFEFNHKKEVRTMNIKEINWSGFFNIIDTRKPEGYFYMKDGRGVYVGIDNSTGDAWCEEFDTKEECIAWLKGELPESKDGERIESSNSQN